MASRCRHGERSAAFGLQAQRAQARPRGERVGPCAGGVHDRDGLLGHAARRDLPDIAHALQRGDLGVQAELRAGRAGAPAVPLQQAVSVQSPHVGFPACTHDGLAPQDGHPLKRLVQRHFVHPALAVRVLQAGLEHPFLPWQLEHQRALAVGQEVAFYLNLQQRGQAGLRQRAQRRGPVVRHHDSCRAAGGVVTQGRLLLQHQSAAIWRQFSRHRHPCDTASDDQEVPGCHAVPSALSPP